MTVSTARAQPVRAPFVRVFREAVDAFVDAYDVPESREFQRLAWTNDLETASFGTKRRMLRGLVRLYEIALQGDPSPPLSLHAQAHAKQLRFWLSSAHLARRLREP